MKGKKYSVFEFYVIEINNQYFICKYDAIKSNYIEFFTKKIIPNNDKLFVEELQKFFPPIAICNYLTMEPLRLSAFDILKEYIYLNNLKEYDEELMLEDLIEEVLITDNDFYKRIGERITSEEREYIQRKLNQSCSNCTNDNCRASNYEKIGLDEDGKPMGNSCIGWINDVMVGKYKVLKLNKKN